MPIVFVHGVNTRDHSAFQTAEPLLRNYIAPKIASDPSKVLISEVYWGDIAATMAWDGASRPHSPILHQGPEDDANVLRRALLTVLQSKELRGIPTNSAPSGGSGIVVGGPVTNPAKLDLRLSRLTPDQLSDLLASSLAAQIKDPNELAQKLLIADAIAHDPNTRVVLSGKPSLQAELEYLVTELNARGTVLAQGWTSDMADTLKEALERAGDSLGWALTRVAAEGRKPLQEFISRFLGDLLKYLVERGDATRPGPIPSVLLKKLEEAAAHPSTLAGERIVVMSHSMGGQLVYDALTHFIPQSANPAHRKLRIDFWCATASQQGFFEELKLFIASDPAIGNGKSISKVPFPPNLGYWYSVWDHNDFLSFTAKDIFEGVVDESYDGGLWLVPAHSGYLVRPSFYRRFAEQIDLAAKAKWKHP
jgi:hypothetical protein